MRPQQIEAMHELARNIGDIGVHWIKYLESSFLVHGHICGGMPLGFRAGITALAALGVQRELNMAMQVVVETGKNHAAICFADGVQMATGCTFGKGLIRRTDYGKWALTLIDQATRNSIRVSVKPGIMENALQSKFVQMRRQGVLASDVPVAISRPLVEGMLSKAGKELFTVSEQFESTLTEDPSNGACSVIRCAECGEGVAGNSIRLEDTRSLCLPCSKLILRAHNRS